MRVAHVVEVAVVAAGIATTSWFIAHSPTSGAAPGNSAPPFTAAKPSTPKIPEESEEQRLLRVLKVDCLDAAAARLQVANLAETSDDRKRQLWKEITVLDEVYIEKATPLLEDGTHDKPEFEWIWKGVETAAMRLRMLRDRLRNPGPAPK
jgi:hypothetical protein